MKLQVFKQTTYEGCLPICLLGLGGIQITREKELELIQNGVSKPRDGYYAFNMLSAFVERYSFYANLYVDNKYYSKYLSKFNKNKEITIFHQLITEDFISQQRKPFILYCDWYSFEDYTHAPHFIVVERQEGIHAFIFDPWVGEIIKMKKKKILDSVLELEKRFNFSPLLITLDFERKHE